jgi:hypothetical protein
MILTRKIFNHEVAQSIYFSSYFPGELVKKQLQGAQPQHPILKTAQDHQSQPWGAARGAAGKKTGSSVSALGSGPGGLGKKSGR